MQIAICDDEISVQQILEEKVKGLFPDAVVEKYTFGEDFIASGCKPDILFLDVQMPGKNGIETAKCIRMDNEDTIIIFITALDDHRKLLFSYMHCGIVKTDFKIKKREGRSLCVELVIILFCLTATEAVKTRI